MFRSLPSAYQSSTLSEDLPVQTDNELLATARNTAIDFRTYKFPRSAFLFDEFIEYYDRMLDISDLPYSLVITRGETALAKLLASTADGLAAITAPAAAPASPAPATAAPGAPAGAPVEAAVTAAGRVIELVTRFAQVKTGSSALCGTGTLPHILRLLEHLAPLDTTTATCALTLYATVVCGASAPLFTPVSVEIVRTDAFHRLLALRPLLARAGAGAGAGRVCEAALGGVARCLVGSGVAVTVSKEDSERLNGVAREVRDRITRGEGAGAVDAYLLRFNQKIAYQSFSEDL